MQKPFEANVSKEQMYTYLHEHDADDCNEDCLEDCGALKSCYFLNWCLLNFPKHAKQIVAIALKEDDENRRIQLVANLVGVPVPYVLA